MVGQAAPYVVNLRNPLSELPRCPQCGTAKPTLHLQAVLEKERVGNSDLWSSWIVYQCTSCRDPICFLANVPRHGDIGAMRTWFAVQSYVAGWMLPGYGGEDLSDWPERARKYMRQAIETLAAPDGAVMLAGSAVDSMLKEKGLTEGSVYSRIEKAVTDNLLTPAMGEWAHAVRLSSNNPRHADLDEPHATADEAKATIEFAKALGQFLFALPAKIARGKEAAEKAKEDPGPA